MSLRRFAAPCWDPLRPGSGDRGRPQRRPGRSPDRSPRTLQHHHRPPDPGDPEHRLDQQAGRQHRPRVSRL